MDILNKNYLDMGHVSSFVPFFWVPKENKDVYVVYNGSKSGANDCMRVPIFLVLSVYSLFQLLTGIWNIDLDIAGYFLNFMMPRNLRSSIGVDLTPIFLSKIRIEKFG